VSLTRSGSQSTGGYQSISTLDNFHFTNVTPPYGRYSVGSNGSTEAYSPYWNNSGSTGSGSDSFIDYGSRQATPSSTTSVMMTTPVDNSFMPQQSKRSCRFPMCVGCGHPIERSYISTSPGVEWHYGCLKCTACGCYLAEMRTCFVKHDKPYCKSDYFRLFAPKCTKCKLSLVKGELMMKIRDNKHYHVHCFRCYACQHQLIPGDSFVTHDDGSIFCMKDYDRIFNQSNGSEERGRIIDGYTNHVLPASSAIPAEMIGTQSRLSGPGHHLSNNSGPDRPKEPGGSGNGSKRRPGKTTRQRTVLNEKQLTVLHTFYENNCRPDAIMKEQLTTMTGLPQRVIRVWFQNKRCKDKKRSLALKQQQEQQQKQQQQMLQLRDGTQQNQLQKNENGNSGVNVNPNSANSNVSMQTGCNGISMSGNEVGTSNNVPGSMISQNSMDASNYQGSSQQQPAWKALSDFALQSEIEKPPFQQLVNNFSDQGPSSLSDSSDVCSIPSVSSHSYDHTSTCTTPLAHDSTASVCS